MAPDIELSNHSNRIRCFLFIRIRNVVNGNGKLKFCAIGTAEYGDIANGH